MIFASDINEMISSINNFEIEKQISFLYDLCNGTPTFSDFAIIDNRIFMLSDLIDAIIVANILTNNIEYIKIIETENSNKRFVKLFQHGSDLYLIPAGCDYLIQFDTVNITIKKIIFNSEYISNYSSYIFLDNKLHMFSISNSEILSYDLKKNSFEYVNINLKLGVSNIVCYDKHFFCGLRKSNELLVINSENMSFEKKKFPKIKNVISHICVWNNKLILVISTGEVWEYDYQRNSLLSIQDNILNFDDKKWAFQDCLVWKDLLVLLPSRDNYLMTIDNYGNIKNTIVEIKPRRKDILLKKGYIYNDKLWLNNTSSNMVFYFEYGIDEKCKKKISFGINDDLKKIIKKSIITIKENSSLIFEDDIKMIINIELL